MIKSKLVHKERDIACLLLCFVGLLGLVASSYALKYFIGTSALWAWYFMLILSCLLILPFNYFVISSIIIYISKHTGVYKQ